MKFAAGVIVSMVAMFAAVFFYPHGGSTAAEPVGDRLTCTVTKVHDGDGPIWCSERGNSGKPIKLRLQAVAARELDETCSPGHPCPEASGAQAKAALEQLALGQTLSYEPTGTSYERVTAWAWREDGTELNCAMVRSKTVLPWPKFDPDQRLCRSSD